MTRRGHLYFRRVKRAKRRTALQSAQSLLTLMYPLRMDGRAIPAGGMRHGCWRKDTELDALRGTK